MKVILSRYPTFLIKETDELDDNHERKHKAINADSGASFGPASQPDVRDWIWRHDLVENLGLFESEDAASEAGDRYNSEMRAKYMSQGYTKVACSMNLGIVNSILEEKIEKEVTPENIKEKLPELFGGGIRVREVGEQDCEIHNFLNDDDDEPTLN